MHRCTDLIVNYNSLTFLQNAVPFLMLCILLLHANLMAFDYDVLCKLWSPVNNVAAISLDAVANSYLVIDVLLNKLIN